MECDLGVVSSSCAILETLAGCARRSWRGSGWLNGSICFDALAARSTAGRGQLICVRCANEKHRKSCQLYGRRERRSMARGEKSVELIEKRGIRLMDKRIVIRASGIF